MRLTNDQILNALLAGHVTTHDLGVIIEIHNMMVTLGIKPTNYVRTETKGMTDKDRQTAVTFAGIVHRLSNPNDDQIKTAHEALVDWKQKHPANIVPGAYGPEFQNKITLIKTFRVDYNTGLADAKHMIEVMYA